MPQASSNAAAAVPTRAARLGRDLAAATVVSLAGIAFYVSTASLLFQGPLLPYLPVAIGATLLGGAVLAVVAAWRGTLPLASGGPEPATVPVLATITAQVAAQVSGPGLLPTAVVTMALTGLAIGAVWWLLGLRGWGDLMRFIPYPVIGGFIGSVGWLMLVGGLGVTMGQGFSFANAWQWLASAGDGRLLAGVLIGFAIWRVTLRVKHPLTLPLLLAGGVLLVHAGLAAAGIGLEQARQAGWLLAPFSRTLPLLPWHGDLLAQVHWQVVAEQLPLIVSAVIVATISLLLSDTSLEVAWDARADMNQDLRALGQGNLLTVAAGGLVGGISISRSVLNRAAGASGRWAGGFKGGLCLLAMAGGGPVIALVPRPLLGGVLVYLGLGMLKNWLVDSRRQLPRQEYAIVATMVAVTALWGFLPAVCVGVLACCVDFAAASARLSPLRRMIDRGAWPARSERGPAERALLQAAGARRAIVELQGVLFFGTATRLSQHVEPRLEAADRPECLLFDFAHVRGIDTSAAQALARLFKTATRLGVRIELSGLNPTLQRALHAGGAMTAAAVHADVDAAVDAWDDEVLRGHAGDAAPDAALGGWLPEGLSAADLLAQFQPQTLAAGAWLFRRGDVSDALYLVRSGRLAIVAESEGGDTLLRTVHAGSVIGEMGLLRQAPRSASVRALEDTEVLRLAGEGFERLARERPQALAALYRLLLVQMAGRVDQLGLQAHALAR